LPVLDEIDQVTLDQEQAKVELGLNPEKFCVALGYAASKGQRQLDLIEVARTGAGVFGHIQFIVPCQYGDPEQIVAARQAVESLRLAPGGPDILILDTFFDTRKSAVMRLATDVLVNHSVSDAFSGTVSEVLYAGNLVLAARHLEYASMPGFGDALKQYDDLSGMASSLILANLMRWRAEASIGHAATRRRLNEMCSWKRVTADWADFIFSGPRPVDAMSGH
jgi:hypothetical protein